MAWVDLHVHSTMSDGAVSPAGITEAALQHGLCMLAIADHDTLSGVSEAGGAAEGTGLFLVPAVELSVNLHTGGSAHLLGYFPGADPASWDGGTLEAALERIRKSREDRNSRIIGSLNDLGIPLTKAEIGDEAGDGVTGRLHIARVLLQKGVVGSIDQAFKDFLGSGAPAYIPRERLGDYAAIDLIRDNGGFPVLAHPGLLRSRSPEEVRALVASLKDGGLMGIEVYYPVHDTRTTELLLKAAHDMKLMVTGGSDYHGVKGAEDFPWKPGGFRLDARMMRGFIEACKLKKGVLKDGQTQ